MGEIKNWNNGIVTIKEENMGEKVKINYKGMTLEEFISDEPLTFQPFKKMVTWEEGYSPNEHNVMFVNTRYKVVVFMYQDGEIGISEHCALLPDPPKPRRATNRELTRWLIEGKAQIKHSDSDMVYVGWNYKEFEDDIPCSNDVLVRKWSDTEWHEPDVLYMEIEKEQGNADR